MCCCHSLSSQSWAGPGSAATGGKEGGPYYPTAEDVHALGQLPHADEVLREVRGRSLEKVCFHHRVLGLSVDSTQVSHWVSQLRAEILV